MLKQIFFHHHGYLATGKSSVEWSPHFCYFLTPLSAPNFISQLPYTNYFLKKSYSNFPNIKIISHLP